MADLPGTWILDDMAAQVDIRENEQKVTEVRDHVTLQIHQQMKGSDAPETFAMRAVSKSITWTVGGVKKTVRVTGANSGYICVGDGISPIAHPGDYIIRRQTWEWIGPWEKAPSEWNQ